MPRVQLSPDAIASEFQDVAEKLKRGRETLARAKDVTLGACARVSVFSIDNVQLYHYEARAPKRVQTPVLIVYALVNRPDMADLQDERSLIQSLLECGIDVYLIDWGYPNGADRLLGLDDYICRYIDGCVDFIRKAAKVPRLNLLGICQGGTFSTCYSALNPSKVRNLITTVTPIDFHTSNDTLSHLFRYVDVDLLSDSGNLGGDLLNAVFLSLKPFRLAQQKYVHMIDGLDNDAQTQMFLRMEKWIFDSPALAGRAFREFAREFYQRNGLINGTVEIGGQKIDLKRLSMPILNIYAEQDHLVPPPASLALGDHVGTSDYTALSFQGGHIGLYVSARAHGVLPQAITDWLDAH